MELRTFSLIVMGSAYILVGIMHFVKPKFFLKIIPPYIPYPKQVNILVGIIEIALGALLFVPSMTSLAAWGIIALLIAVFPANIYHHQLARKKGRQVMGTLIRLPFQLVLIYWAYTFV